MNNTITSHQLRRTAKDLLMVAHRFRHLPTFVGLLRTR